MRPLILHSEENSALNRGAELLLILDRPGIVPPQVGEQLLGYVGTPDDGAPFEVLSTRKTTMGELTEAEKKAALGATDRKFIPWVMDMLRPLPFSLEMSVYATTVKAVAS